MKVDGGCHCGKVTYEAEIDPARVMVCHCTDCQALSGSAFRVVALTRPGSFRLLSGALRSYTKIGESGTPRLQSFCPDCGSPIHATTPGPEPKVHSLRVGTLRQRGAIMPRLQIWRRSALPWVADLAGLPGEETQPPMDDGGAMR